MRRTASRCGSSTASRVRTPSAMRSRSLSRAECCLASVASVARSAQSLNAATTSRTPRGNSELSSASVKSTRLAACLSARRLQPSNGTSGSIANTTLSLSARSSMSLRRVGIGIGAADIDRKAHAFFEIHQQPQIGHALGIEDAVEMVAFMLQDAGVEAFDGAVDRRAVEADAAIADAGEARHRALKAGDRQTRSEERRVGKEG